MNIDQLKRIQDDIREILNSQPWIKSYEIFIQHINDLSSSYFDYDITSTKHIDRTGVALRIITKDRKLQLENFGLGRLDNLQSILQNSPPTIDAKVDSFSSIKSPRIGSIPGDESNKYTPSQNLLNKQINMVEEHDIRDEIPLFVDLTIQSEFRLISNNVSNPITTKSLKYFITLKSKFSVKNIHYNISRSWFGRNLNLNYRNLLTQLHTAVDYRINSQQTNANIDDMGILLHPDVFGILFAQYINSVLRNQNYNVFKQWDANLELYDDPRKENGFDSYLFDDEGQQTRSKQLVKNSKLEQNLGHYLDQSNDEIGNGYRTSWYEPLTRSFEYPMSSIFSNLVLLGGTGKGDHFTETPESILYVRKGYSSLDMIGQSFNFILHVNEGGIWKNGTLIELADTITIFGNINEVLSSAIMSSDEVPVKNRGQPGSIYLGWFLIPPSIVKVRS